MSISPLSAVKILSFSALALMLAGCGEKDGSKELAVAQSAFEVKDFKKAEKFLLRSESYNHDNVDTLLMLARVKLALGELKASKTWVDKALALAEGDSDVRLLAAQVAWHSKDYKRASELFSKLANDTREIDVVRSDAFAGLGVVEQTCNNRDLARVAFLKAIRFNRRNPAAWYHLGLLYRDAFGYMEAALEQFNIYVRLDTEADVRVQKVQRGLIPALKEIIATAATDRPGASKRNSANCAASIAKAEAAWKKGTFKTARLRYQEALAADPLSYPAALGLAKAYAKTDTTKKGQQKTLEYYKLACSLRPSAVSTYITAGSVAEKLAHWAEAREIYSRAVAANPNSREALSGLVRAMQKVNEKRSVIEAYRLYLETLPKVVTKRN